MISWWWGVSIVCGLSSWLFPLLVILPNCVSAMEAIFRHTIIICRWGVELAAMSPPFFVHVHWTCFEQLSTVIVVDLGSTCDGLCSFRYVMSIWYLDVQLLPFTRTSKDQFQHYSAHRGSLKRTLLWQCPSRLQNNGKPIWYRISTRSWSGCIIPVLYWLLMCFCAQNKLQVITFKALLSVRSAYLKEQVIPLLFAHLLRPYSLAHLSVKFN